MSITHYLEQDADDRQPLASDSFKTIETMILNGTLKNGSRLTERQICALCHVSRTPARETLRRLEAEGLVDVVPNRGAVVHGLNDREIRDLFAAKARMELLTVRWIAERITKEEIDQLREIFGFISFYTDRKDTEKMQNINTAFHEILFRSIHNRILTRQLTIYENDLDHAMPQNIPLTDLLDRQLEEHRDICIAVADHDPDAAEQAVLRHLENTYDRAWDDGRFYPDIITTGGENGRI